MAKYTITFSCGHTETIQLYGSIANREDYIKWASEHGECHACKDACKADKRAKEHEYAVTNAKKYDLPVLEGSEKQISWAIDIRQRMIEEIEMYCKGHSFEEMKEKWQAASENQKEKMLNAEKDTYAYKLSHIFVETSAKFYIENQ